MRFPLLLVLATARQLTSEVQRGALLKPRLKHHHGSSLSEAEAAKAGRDLARRRAPAQATSNERRRGVGEIEGISQNWRDEHQTWMGKQTWDSNDWQKQVDMTGQLKTIQAASHDEATQQEYEMAYEVFQSVVDQMPFFQDSERMFMENTLVIQSQHKTLLDSMKTMLAFFDSQVEDMHANIKELSVKDIAWYQNLKNQMWKKSDQVVKIASHEYTVLTEGDKLKKERLDKDNIVSEEIIAKLDAKDRKPSSTVTFIGKMIKNAVTQIDTMNKKFETAKVDLNNAETALTSKHSEHFSLLGDLEKTLGADLSKLKGNIENLDDSIGTEGDSDSMSGDWMQRVLNVGSQINGDYDKDAQKFYTGDSTQDQGSLYGNADMDLKDDTLKFTDQSKSGDLGNIYGLEDKLTGDHSDSLKSGYQSQFASDEKTINDAVLNLEGEPAKNEEAFEGNRDTLKSSVETPNDALEQSLDDLSDDLIEEIEKMRSYPVDAENKIADKVQEKVAKNTEDREQYLSKFAEEIDQVVGNSETNLENSKTNVDTELEKDQDAMEAKKTTEQNVIESLKQAPHQEIEAQVKNVEDLQDDIADGIKTQGALTSRVSALASQISDADEIIHNTMESNEKMAANNVARIKDGAMNKVESYTKKLSEEWEDTKKDVTDEAEEGGETVQDSYEDSSKIISRNYEDAQGQERKQEAYDQAIKSVLGQRLDLVDDRIEDMQKDTLPSIKAKGVSFMYDAQQQAQKLASNTESALNVANPIINEHIDNLQKSSTQIIGDVRTNVQPVEEKTSARIDQMEHQMKQDNAHLSTSSADEASDLELINENSGHQNDGNEQQLQNFKASIAQEKHAAEQVISGAVVSKNEEQLKMDSHADTALSLFGNYVTEATGHTAAEAKTKIGNSDTSVQDSVDTTVSASSDAQRETAKTMKTVDNEIRDSMHRLVGDKDQLTSLYQAAEADAEKAGSKEGDVDALASDIDGIKDANANAKNGLSNSINSGADGLGTFASDRFEKEEGSSTAALTKAGDGALDEAEKAEAGVAEANANMGAGVSALERESEDSTEGAEAEQRGLRSLAVQSQTNEQKRDATLDAVFAQLTTESEAAHGAFEDQMTASKAVLRAMVAKDHAGMADLIRELDAFEKHTKDSVSGQTAKDKKLIQDMLVIAKAAASDLENGESQTRSEVVGFQKSLERLDKEASAILEGTSKMTEEFQQKMDTIRKAFQTGLNAAKKDRLETTAAWQHQTTENVHQMDTTLAMMKQLREKVHAQVKYEIGTSQLNQDDLDTQLNATANLGKYQGEEMFNILKAKLASASDNEDKLEQLKAALRDESETMREHVQEAFNTLGIDFDMSSVDTAAAEAQEKYYMKQQEERLKEMLQGKMGELNDVSRARLRQLSEESGAKIAELMKRTDLSEAERAAKLAELRASAREAARNIAAQNGRLELEQETAARNLKVATKEVADSMTRIAQLGSNAGVDGAGGLHSTMQRIIDLVDEVNRNTDFDAPADQTTGGMVAAPAEETQSQEEEPPEQEPQSQWIAQEPAPTPNHPNMPPEFYASGPASQSLSESAAQLVADGAQIMGDSTEGRRIVAVGPAGPHLQKAAAAQEGHGLLGRLASWFVPQSFLDDSGPLELKPGAAQALVETAEGSSAAMLAQDDALEARLDALGAKLAT